MAEVMVIARRTNAEMIVDCRTLGYLADGRRTIDVTYGRGAFWKLWKPTGLVEHDLKLDGVDFTALPEADHSFDAVVFDPPYKLNGTATGDVDARYGVDKYASRVDRHRLIFDGIDECVRVLAPGGHLLVKCMDQISSGRARWQTHEVISHVEQKHGLRRVGVLHNEGARPQPAGRRQLHARFNYSTLLVFKSRRRTTARASSSR